MLFEMVKMDGEDDPDRCRGSMAHSQCGHKRIPPSWFCSKHGGAHTAKSEIKKEKKMYQLLQWQSRVGEFAGMERVKSLRDEIGIARFTLEELMKKCDDANKLLVYNPQIIVLLNQIRALVDSAQKLEEKGNLLLDKAVIFHVADAIVKIISEYITDGEQLAKIGEEVANVIEGAVSTTNTTRLAKA